MDKDIFTKPLRICSKKRGKNKLCTFADRHGDFEACILFEFTPEFRQCTATMRMKGIVNANKNKAEKKNNS
jgi:hypothetical protein